MNRIKSFLFTLLFFQSALCQQYLGRVDEMRTLISNNSRQSYSLILPEGDSISYKITSIETSGQRFVIYGLLQNKTGGVTYTFNGENISGEIIIPNQSEHFTIKTINGSVYIMPNDFESYRCDDGSVSVPVNREAANSTLVASIQNIDTRKLQSNPGAPNVFFIDFDGHNVIDNFWMNNYNGGKPFYCQPAGITADNEYTVYKVVCEDYRPFNVNITSDSTVFFTYPVNKRARLVVTTTRAWQTVSTTGIACYSNFGFNDSPAFTFPPGLQTIQNLGEVSSHELGHVVGLMHDGATSPSTEYYAGYNYWAPIMGKGYNKLASQWSKGEYQFANNTEDDLSIISKALGYKTDDHANTLDAATPFAFDINDSIISNNTGIIERNTDVDWFSFSCGNSTLSVNIDPNDVKPNLDIKASLYNKTTQSLIASNDADGVLNSSIVSNLFPGQYCLKIEGVGYGSASNGGYSNYGSLGIYTIKGDLTVLTSETIPEVNIDASFFFNSDDGSFTIQNVSAGVTKLSIYSITGVQWMHSNCSQSPIDLSFLPKGVYIVLIDNMSVGKFAKLR